MKLLSFTSILVYIFVSYMSFSTYKLYTFMVPPECTSKDDRYCLNAAFKQNDLFQLFLCTSLDSHPLAAKLNCFHHNASFRLSDPFEVKYEITLPRQTIANGTLFLHGILTKLMSIRAPDETVLHSKHTVNTVAYLTKYQLKKEKMFNLLAKNAAGCQQQQQVKQSEDRKIQPQRQHPETHWKSRMVLSGLGGPFSLYKSDLPHEILHLMQLDSKQRYMPVIYLSDVRQRLEDLRELPFISSSNVEVTMPLEIVYEPITIGKLRLMVIVEQSFRMMKKFGFADRDFEDLKGIFFDTNHYMLLVTVSVVSLHLLFDFLAFKNDIQFWRHRRTMEGVSFGSILFCFVSQLIITLYLMDRRASLMVVVPSSIATIIELWKLMKVCHIEWVGWFRFTRRPPEKQTELERTTSAHDSDTMRILSYYILPPLLLGGSVYSILYTEHRSWYSWAIESAVNGVYAFGFIAMLPQLIINYRLKSVVHLPWRTFMYKAFNTFIDDFFAFILRSVPTTHRLATFRDDIIFLIYLYQRWLYPIDKNRSIYTEKEKNEDNDKKPIDESKLSEFANDKQKIESKKTK